MLAWSFDRLPAMISALVKFRNVLTTCPSYLHSVEKWLEVACEIAVGSKMPFFKISTRIQKLVLPFQNWCSKIPSPVTLPALIWGGNIKNEVGQKEEQTPRQRFETKLEVCSTSIKVGLLSNWHLELASENVTLLLCPQTRGVGKVGVLRGTSLGLMEEERRW